MLWQVLHLRQLYRPELFERQRLYGITVHKSRHPGLNEYIHSVVTSLKVRPQLYEGSPSRSSCSQDCCSQHQIALPCLPRTEQRLQLSAPVSLDAAEVSPCTESREEVCLLMSAPACCFGTLLP